MAKPTSVSARTPPNRKDTPRTSRLVATKRIPPGHGAFQRRSSSVLSSDPSTAVTVRPCIRWSRPEPRALVPVWDRRPYRPRWSSIGESAILKCLPADNSATKFAGRQRRSSLVEWRSIPSCCNAAESGVTKSCGWPSDHDFRRSSEARRRLVARAHASGDRGRACRNHGAVLRHRRDRVHGTFLPIGPAW
ncbi:hypothetical protein ACVME5_004666 [Bradyrhizobium liaoningense]